MNQVELKISEISRKMDDLRSKLSDYEIRLSNIEKNLTSNGSTVQVIITQQNLSAPEIIYEKVKDSVVLIKARAVVQTIFGKAYTSSEGSGFIYSEAGYIVTNYHVVENAETIQVFLSDRSVYTAEIVGVDAYSDIAVLKINVGEKILHPLVLGDSSKLRVGQPVIAVGNPFGLTYTLTTGVISQLNRLLESPGGRSIPNVVQFDASVNPGSSGGPLLDYSGKVIGVTTAIASTTGEFAGVGFAIPSNTVSRVVKSLIETGKYEHPWMGIGGIDVNMEIAQLMNLQNAYGFLITGVAKDSPAEKAGLRAGDKTVRLSDGTVLNIGGDVIIGVDHIKVFGLSDLLSYIEEYKRPGDQITLKILRGGIEIDVSLILGAIVG
ncbi:MAG: trypsin-like peptidase domain-containing protein [Nitrososphaerota archaeon]|nr:trypsin-like peptidase domain-containing protein [Nitrososphaerota archaeon]